MKKTTTLTGRKLFIQREGRKKKTEQRGNFTTLVYRGDRLRETNRKTDMRT